ncbi:serine hydrolase domain-containing protein [Paenibacillus taiwanensis]|uniref:serine hydrolase domain-containing protein n=1 Tax=Paenibacillus taiwanensis TaxID=401638 RepID=UPI0004038774|nr:serine hydrolase domain-containing protein [Paenibacillus taiwanensis]
MIKTKLVTHIQHAVSKQKFSGSVLVAREGNLLVSQGFGMANYEWGIPNTSETKFRIGSVTKSLTAAAVLQCCEMKGVSIDDPIGCYLPHFVSGHRITIRHLLTNTSGIPNFTVSEDIAVTLMQPVGVNDLIERFNQQTLEFNPGDQFSYSNSGYVLLGKLIEVMSGQAYDHYMREHVCKPLSMRHTGLDVNGEVLAGRASGYEFDQSGILRNASYIDMSNAYSAGGLYSTVEDLYRWERALTTGDLMSPKLVTDMFTTYKGGYGMGWFISDSDPRMMFHHGGINGFTSSLLRYPDEHLTVVVLSNFVTMTTSVLAGELAHLVLGE